MEGQSKSTDSLIKDDDVEEIVSNKDVWTLCKFPLLLDEKKFTSKWEKIFEELREI